jgi:hypothetical protein
MITGCVHFQGDIVKNRGEENFQNHPKDTKLHSSKTIEIVEIVMIFNRSAFYID